MLFVLPIQFYITHTMMLPIINKSTRSDDSNYKPPTQFPIGGNGSSSFTKYKNNPILKPNPKNDWESTYLYNASAIVIEDKVYLLYRAQNKQKVSSVGLAWLDDGYNFTRFNDPILSPTESYELKGGIEDPRIIRDPKLKLFILTYTAYDGSRARLSVATSENLFDWTKHGPIIANDDWNDIAILSNGDQIIRHGWSKSGAIFSEKNKSSNKYYMIWGDCAFHLAESDDLINWKLPSHNYHSNLFTTGKFDWQNRLIEPGPAPIKLNTGNPNQNYWVLFYNSSTTGGGKYPKNTYVLSQMLIDYDNIKNGPIARTETPFLIPELGNEVEGQVDQVVFTEGIVQYKGKWFLYFGQGDSELGVATADA